MAIGKLHDTHTGDTLCDEKNQICYPAIGLPRPVLSFAIEAKSKAEIEKVLGFRGRDVLIHRDDMVLMGGDRT